MIKYSIGTIEFEVGDEITNRDGVKGKVISRYPIKEEIQVEFENDEVLCFEIDGGGCLIPSDTNVVKK